MRRSDGVCEPCRRNGAEGTHAGARAHRGARVARAEVVFPASSPFWGASALDPAYRAGAPQPPQTLTPGPALQPPARKKRRTWCACSAPPATAATAGLGARPEHPAPFASSPPPARRAARARLRVSMHSGPVRGWMTPSRRAGVSSSTSMRVERRGVGVNDADASESSIRVLKTAPAARPFWGREVWGCDVPGALVRAAPNELERVERWAGPAQGPAGGQRMDESFGER